jgi:hypothetical protein
MLPQVFIRENGMQGSKEVDKVGRKKAGNNPGKALNRP